MNTRCSDQRRWWTRADLTNVADEQVLFWPTLLMIPYGEDDEPRGPRGRATDRWRCHLSSTTTTKAEGVDANVHTVDTLQVGDYDGWW